MNKQRINVLHVEDEPIQRVLVRSHLESMADLEFNVEDAESEQSAVDRIRSGGVDLVLLDYQLAQGDGLSCLKAIRSIDSRLPVIALSGAADSKIVENLLDFGADDFSRRKGSPGSSWYKAFVRRSLGSTPGNAGRVVAAASRLVDRMETAIGWSGSWFRILKNGSAKASTKLPGPLVGKRSTRESSRKSSMR